MSELRKAAQAALEALQVIQHATAPGLDGGGHEAAFDLASAAEDKLRAALAEPQPEPADARKLVNDFARAVAYGEDADRLRTGDALVAALGQAPQAQQPEPAAQSRTIREIICYVRENDLGSIGDEWIAALQASQPDPKCSLGCTTECKAKEHGCASECPVLPWQPQPQPEPVAWQYKDTDQVVTELPGYRPASEDWRPLYAAPQAQQPLTDEQVTELRAQHGWAKETIRAIERAIGIKS